MRDPNRIVGGLETIREAWIKVPDWRLGQLIYNALRAKPSSPDLFSIEDHFLEKLVSRLPEGLIFTRHAFNVGDTIEVTERGVLVAADKQYSELPPWLNLSQGDYIEFNAKDGTTLRTNVASICTLSESTTLCFSIPSDIAKEQIPIGSEVWVTESSAN